jgi:hypothetical protein
MIDTRGVSLTPGRIAITLALAVDVALFVGVVAQRLFFPYELEWMTGSVLDSIERLRSGAPLYAEPSASWIPFIYPPLYYWVGALLGGSALACRLVSLVSALFQAVMARRIARDLGATLFWAAVSGALVLACFPYAGWWYDLERSDTLGGAMILGTCALLVRARTPRAHAVAGLVAGLAFFAKQQAVFYVAGAIVALVATWRREGKRVQLMHLAAFAVTAFAVIGLLAAFLDARSGGWFRYYVVHVPGAHGLTWALAREWLPDDVGGGFLLVASTLAMGALAVRLRAGAKKIEHPELLFTCLLVAGFVASVSSRLHIGGWVNVLAPWTSLACVGVGIVATRIEQSCESSPRRSMVRGLVAAAMVGQLALWLYDPRPHVPDHDLATSTEQFHAIVQELEQRGDGDGHGHGEVLVVPRGHVTQKRHFQMAALADVVRADGHSPPDLVDALRTRRFAAIIDDARDAGPLGWRWPAAMLEDIDDLRIPLFSSYFVARRIDDTTARLVTSAPGKPRWVLLPRTMPLTLAPEELAARHLREIRLAQERADLVRRGAEPPFSEAEIEARAALPGP